MKKKKKKKKKKKRILKQVHVLLAGRHLAKLIYFVYRANCFYIAAVMVLGEWGKQ